MEVVMTVCRQKNRTIFNTMRVWWQTRPSCYWEGCWHWIHPGDFRHGLRKKTPFLCRIKIPCIGKIWTAIKKLIPVGRFMSGKRNRCLKNCPRPSTVKNCWSRIKKGRCRQQPRGRVTTTQRRRERSCRM